MTPKQFRSLATDALAARQTHIDVLIVGTATKRQKREHIFHLGGGLRGKILDTSTPGKTKVRLQLADVFRLLDGMA